MQGAQTAFSHPPLPRLEGPTHPKVPSEAPSPTGPRGKKGQS